MSSNLVCPVSSCHWQLMMRDNPPDGRLASLFGVTLLDTPSYTEHVQDIETRLREHFETHGIAELVAEIIRLRNELARRRS